jgi:hypothetical protein
MTVYDCDLMSLSQEGVGSGDSGDSGTEYDDVGH